MYLVLEAPWPSLLDDMSFVLQCEYCAFAVFFHDRIAKNPPPVDDILLMSVRVRYRGRVTKTAMRLTLYFIIDYN